MTTSGSVILIVDDEAAVTLALEGYFQSRGFRVIKAFYGDQAIARIEKDHPELVILDLQMPGIDGVAVLEKTRKSYPKTKTLVITGYWEQYRSQIERLKPEAVQQKPVSLEELTRTVEALLDGKPAKGAAQKTAVSGKIQLLFVEGDPELYRQVLKPHFENPERRPSFETALASTPEEAFRRLKEFKPHLVVLDSTRLPVGVDPGKLAADLGRVSSAPPELILYALPFSQATGERPSAAHLKRLEESIERSLQCGPAR